MHVDLFTPEMVKNWLIITSCRHPIHSACGDGNPDFSYTDCRFCWIFHVNLKIPYTPYLSSNLLWVKKA